MTKWPQTWLLPNQGTKKTQKNLPVWSALAKWPWTWPPWPMRGESWISLRPIRAQHFPHGFLSPYIRIVPSMFGCEPSPKFLYSTHQYHKSFDDLLDKVTYLGTCSTGSRHYMTRLLRPYQHAMSERIKSFSWILNIINILLWQITVESKCYKYIAIVNIINMFLW